MLAGTCAGARRLLEAWLGLAPLGAPLGACSALLRFPGERYRTAATPEWTPLHYCPCTMRCKDGYALNALLEGPHLGEAIVVDDRLVNRPDARYVRHLWCGGYGGRDGCAQKRSASSPVVTGRATPRRSGRDTAARRVAPEAGGSGIVGVETQEFQSSRAS